MLKRKKIYDDCDSDDNDFIKKSKSHQIDQQSNDTNNNVNNEQYTAADNDADNDDDDDESDSVSLEILWQPQSGTQITADVVFIHGLHGKFIERNGKRNIWNSSPTIYININFFYQ